MFIRGNEVVEFMTTVVVTLHKSDPTPKPILSVVWQVESDIHDRPLMHDSQE